MRGFLEWLTILVVETIFFVAFYLLFHKVWHAPVWGAVGFAWLLVGQASARSRA